jgi:hypothetical protein
MHIANEKANEKNTLTKIGFINPIFWTFKKSWCRSSMKTKLHEAAERGESEELQRLLDSGSYDVNEGNDEKYFVGVCDLKEGERERERGVDLLFLPSHLHTVNCVR